VRGTCIEVAGSERLWWDRKDRSRSVRLGIAVSFYRLNARFATW